MMKKWCLVMVVLLMLSGCSQRKADISKYTGTVEATKYNVTTDIGGMIKEIFVNEGDTVEAGMVVMQLDDTTLNYGVLQQEANYYAKQEQLKDIKKGSSSEEIAMAEQELEKALINVETLKEIYEHTSDGVHKTQILFNEGAIHEQQLKDSKLQLDQSRAAVENAEKTVSVLSLKVELLKKGATEEMIRSNEYSVEQLRHAYEQAINQKEKTEVKSTQGGIVQYKYYNKGELFTSGAPIITLLDPEDLYMKIYLPEKDIHLIKIGRGISLSSDMVQEQLTGEIIFISPQAEFTPSNVTTKEDRHSRVHEVKIKITEGAKYLNAGMILDANLEDENAN